MIYERAKLSQEYEAEDHYPREDEPVSYALSPNATLDIMVVTACGVANKAYHVEGYLTISLLAPHAKSGAPQSYADQACRQSGPD